MGYQLRRWLREELGAHISGLQRAVALEIADDANDETHLSYASLDNLARWTGAKDTEVVRNALKRLAAQGWEFRVPMGTGKDGRTIYAVPGRRLTFRVPKGVAAAPPTVQGTAVAVPKGEPRLLKGGAGARSQGATAPTEGATATPFSSAPQIPSPIPSSIAHPDTTAAAPQPSTDEVGRKERTEEQRLGHAIDVLTRLDFGRNVKRHESIAMAHRLAGKLAHGWTPRQLHEAIDTGWNGAIDRVAVTNSRIDALPEQPPQRRPTVPLPPPVIPPDYGHAASAETVAQRAAQARAHMRRKSLQ